MYVIFIWLAHIAAMKRGNACLPPSVLAVKSSHLDLQLAGSPRLLALRQKMLKCVLEAGLADVSNEAVEYMMLALEVHKIACPERSAALAASEAHDTDPTYAYVRRVVSPQGDHVVLQSHDSTARVATQGRTANERQCDGSRANAAAVERADWAARSAVWRRNSTASAGREPAHHPGAPDTHATMRGMSDLLLLVVD